MPKIAYTYDQEDIKKAFDLHYNKTFPIRSKWLFFIGLIFTLVGLMMFLFNYKSYPVLKWLFVLMGLFYIGFYHYRRNLMVKTAMKNPTIKDVNQVEITNDFIKFSGETGFAKQEWKDFNFRVEDDNSILLYISKNNFFILPKAKIDKTAISIVQEKIKNK